jgi:hypothetical protein
MVIASLVAFWISCIMITELDMISHATRSPTTSAGMAMHSRISSYFKMIMRMIPALTVTSVKWGRTVHGGGHPEVYMVAWFYDVDVSI